MTNSWKNFSLVYPVQPDFLQFLGQIVGLGHALACCLSHTVCSHGCHIYRGGQSAPCLVGAHVGAGLLTAYMLFTGLESKNKGPSSLMIGCLAYNTARQLPGHGCRGCHKAQITVLQTPKACQGAGRRPQPISARIRAGVFITARAIGIAAHDVLGAGLMDDASQSVPVLYIAVIVGLLHIEAGGLGVCLQHLFQSCPIRYPVFFR